ncbi:hypothetical protein DPX16_11687 [Anabarilius grahami]|uniref:Uncharacterized protein n=1 Tax=Anabarilius grahami TaxID=495550 RepID=A0A3N0Z863_ANAGA|nr:hypothetical protein DPX16_11687 [Anabarilius grahami]
MLSEKLAAVTIAERAKAAHMLLSHQSGIDRCVRTADSADTVCLLVSYLSFLHEKEGHLLLTAILPYYKRCCLSAELLGCSLCVSCLLSSLHRRAHLSSPVSPAFHT